MHAAMRSVRLLILLAASASACLAACRSDALPTDSGDDADLSSATDGAVPARDSSVDLAVAAACIGLAECDCFAHRSCAPVTENCYCPTCDPNGGACLCGGGRYFGCAPAASHCPSVNCTTVQGAAGPDANGCFACAAPTGCDQALRNLKGNCHFSDNYVGDLQCGAHPDCVLGCLRKVLTKCEDVGCNYCTTCDCAGGGNQAFVRCVGACQ